jgi:ribosomal protein S18 acetylase RimI-like enzyme
MVEVWNAAASGRGAVAMQGATWMEYFLFSKPYFDPQGLIIACDDNQIAGFALAGLGPNETETALNPRNGVLCMLAVAPSHRRRGIGSELLRRAEDYLRSKDSQNLFAGPMYPLNPYGFGLYGGSGSAGFLDSDALIRPFLERHGYVVDTTNVVLQRSMKRALSVSDGRFAAHRLRYEIQACPFQGTTWWQECILGPIELHEYCLRDKLTSHTAARALMWEMETYAGRWGEHAIGISDIIVPPDMRRQGLAKFLLTQILRYLHDQFFTLIEIHAPAGNTAAVNLLHSLGFEQVDTGRIYRLKS